MWPNSQFSENLVTFTEEIFNGKLHFLYIDGRLYMSDMTLSVLTVIAISLQKSINSASKNNWR